MEGGEREKEREREREREREKEAQIEVFVHAATLLHTLYLLLPTHSLRCGAILMLHGGRGSWYHHVYA